MVPIAASLAVAVMVYSGSATKLAVTVMSAFTVRVIGLSVEVISPVQPVNS